MKVPLSWLREYVPVGAPASEIADRLSIATAEVNEVVRLGVSDVGGNLGLFQRSTQFPINVEQRQAVING